MKSYSDLSADLQCKICKDQLRPMAATIFGHLYQAEASKGNQWMDADSTITTIARRSVLAASAICHELNEIYGSQLDEPYDFE